MEVKHQQQVLLLLLSVSSTLLLINDHLIILAYSINNNISLRGCPETCGSVKIPYPFGTKQGCYYNKNFLLNCKQTNPSHSPKLFFPNSTFSTILHISIQPSEILVKGKVSRDCYDKSGKLIDKQSKLRSLMQTKSNKFPLSTRNKFIGVGCDTVATIGGNIRGGSYVAGCVASCYDINDVVNSSCSGIGCCETDIPPGVSNVVTHVQSLNNGNSTNHSLVHHFNPCGYSFVAENGSYNFTTVDLKDLMKNKKKFPRMVLDWAVGNLTCEEAKLVNNRSGNGYACVAEYSECVNSTNGSGYQCKCLNGYEGNPYLHHGCQDINECERFYNICKERQCKNGPGTYNCSCPHGYTSTSTLLLNGSSWIYWGAKKRKLILLKQKFFQQNGGFLLQQQLVSNHLLGAETAVAKIFTANELEKATNNFDQSRIIGQGSYGTVYKGVLTDNKMIAIKKSKIGDQSQIEQFINEVIVLTQINHRNVVKLLGCCLDTEVPLLVYEFITNGTLYEHLHNTLGQHSSILSWEMRLKIAIETAGAIAYLHSSTSISIIHRDVKTANILIDDNYIAKVSDFGASRLVPIDKTQLTTLVQGTLGYLDPEYFHTSQLTEKSDVYSFGVVLAELLTGQKALSFDRSENERNLALYFISSMEEDDLLRILDHNLITSVEDNMEKIKVMANVAKGCLRVRGEERPTMKEVASELEGLIERELHPWGEEDLNVEETEYLLESSGLCNMCTTEIFNGCNIYGGSFSNISVARMESLSNEIYLESYGDGR
ncbi:hypothetical protein G4B88_027828 [Cannabis sativa]|uniref:Uncharacterized protein n=1 Tax=Cannabis sativa TaxID=3483 RepID=A0A7J6DKU3_CANSA|nr:hypothetical protein G4B88_027828 [Cannabis sativa]